MPIADYSPLWPGRLSAMRAQICRFGARRQLPRVGTIATSYPLNQRLACHGR